MKPETPMNFKMLLSVHDRKAELWHYPQLVDSKNAAIRAVQGAANDDQLPFKKHPHDYDFYLVGKYSAETGLFELFEADEYILIGSAADFKDPTLAGIPNV